jgi:hypothetical protein
MTQGSKPLPISLFYFLIKLQLLIRIFVSSGNKVTSHRLTMIKIILAEKPAWQNILAAKLQS